MVKIIKLGAFGSRTNLFSNIIKSRSYSAYAQLKGSPEHSLVRGRIEFYGVPGGTLAVAEAYGLPEGERPCSGKVFAFHIHSGVGCTGNEKDPFANAGTHYNPNNCQHPQHAGDMPPLFGNEGYAWQAFFTDRFHPDDIIGHTVIIHGGVDDFTTQPAGNAGAKIACGEIKRG